MLAMTTHPHPPTPTVNPLPPTSLVICSRNRPKLLFESVASVLSGEAVPTELLIMDQSDWPHPTLSTLGQTRGCDVRYIRTRAQGESPAKNEAMTLARYSIVVFTDDDVLVTPTWLRTLVEAIQAGGPKSVVMGQVPPLHEEAEGFAPTRKVGDAPETYVGRVGRDVLCPINMGMYRSAVEEVGGFDERLGAGAPFPGAEDNDFGFRLLEAGYRILYEPSAVVYHRAWRRERDYLPLKWTYGRGQGAFYAKYMSLRDRYILDRMIYDVTRHVRRLPQRVRWLDRRGLLGDIVYTLGLLSGATEWVLTQGRAPGSADA